MKIVFLVDHLLSGGAERTVSYLSSYLAKKDWDVTVLSVSDAVFYSLHPSVFLQTLSVPQTGKNRAVRLINAAKRVWRVQRYLKKNKPDVLFCMLPETARYVDGFYKKMGIPLITSERNNPVFERQSLQPFKEKLFGECDGVVFQTQRAKEFYRDIIGERGCVIHNAVGNESVYSVPAISQRKPKISAIGRVAKQKDYPTLLCAFAEVQKIHPELTLEIFGNATGEYADGIREIVKKLALEDSVRFMGVCADAILQAADSACYVMSSVYEGMPNALMEAMAVGLPCVSTDCPNGPGELIEDEKNGLLTPVGDVNALARAILRIVEDGEFARSLGERAKEILQTHSIEKKAAEYERYILQVIGKGERYE